MLEVLVLLAVGWFAGWLWAARRREPIPPCPRCEVEDHARELLIEINGLKHQGQEAMRQAANEGRHG